MDGLHIKEAAEGCPVRSMCSAVDVVTSVVSDFAGIVVMTLVCKMMHVCIEDWVDTLEVWAVRSRHVLEVWVMKVRHALELWALKLRHLVQLAAFELELELLELL